MGKGVSRRRAKGEEDERLCCFEVERLGVWQALEPGPHLLRWSSEKLEDLYVAIGRYKSTLAEEEKGSGGRKATAYRKAPC